MPIQKWTGTDSALENLFEIRNAHEKFDSRHMGNIPRIKFFAQRRYRTNWPFLDGHSLQDQRPGIRPGMVVVVQTVSLPPMTSGTIWSADRFPWLPGSGSCGVPPNWWNSNRIFGYPA